MAAERAGERQAGGQAGRLAAWEEGVCVFVRVCECVCECVCERGTGCDRVSLQSE